MDARGGQERVLHALPGAWLQPGANSPVFQDRLAAFAVLRYGLGGGRAGNDLALRAVSRSRWPLVRRGDLPGRVVPVLLPSRWRMAVCRGSAPFGLHALLRGFSAGCPGSVFADLAAEPVSLVVPVDGGDGG